ncbi:MAG: single-stranded DNA-binding protein [Nautiliaceae bacterium]|jgi:single-strand DNA-binding protein
MYNKVILVGNLTRDVELKYTPTGTAIAKFGLATNRTYKDSVTGENKQEVMFIDITVFGRSAEIANQYLRKGRRVLIEGRLVLDQWVDAQGQKRSKHSIVAEKVQFMESKASAEDNSGYQQTNYQQPQPAPQPQMQQPQQQNNIPSIDIDDEEIPF